MRVFVIGRGFPTQENPMNGIFEFDQAKALAAYGHEVVYLALDLRSIRRIRKFGLKTFSDSGVNVCTLDVPVGNVQDSLFVKIGSASLVLLYNKAAALYGKPDILHSHFPNISACAAAVSKQNGLPLVVTEHSSAVLTAAQSGEELPTAKAAYETSSAVIAVSEHLANLIKTSYSTKVTYIPNIIDTSLFIPVTGIEHDTFTFITVGNLVESKRQDLTIRAFSKAFAQDKTGTCRAQIIIVGDGPQRDALTKLADKLKITDFVKFTGKIPREEIAKLFGTADCFVLASDYETFGVVYAEAMAAGLPVIATKCGGPECFVNDDNGILISPGDEAALSQAMLEMYSGLCSSFNKPSIKNFVQKTFSPGAVAAQITRVYEECLQQ